MLFWIIYTDYTWVTYTNSGCWAAKKEFKFYSCRYYLYRYVKIKTTNIKNYEFIYNKELIIMYKSQTYTTYVIAHHFLHYTNQLTTLSCHTIWMLKISLQCTRLNLPRRIYYAVVTSNVQDLFAPNPVYALQISFTRFRYIHLFIDYKS